MKKMEEEQKEDEEEKEKRRIEAWKVLQSIEVIEEKVKMKMEV